MNNTKCTNCEHFQAVPPHYIGRTVKCQNCGSEYVASLYSPPKAISKGSSAGLIVGGVVAVLIVSAAGLFFLSGGKKKEEKNATSVSPQATSEVQPVAPAPPRVPPIGNLAVHEVSDDAECKIWVEGFHKLAAGIRERSKLEMIDEEQTHQRILRLPYGGVYQLRIPRSTSGLLKKDFYSVIVLDQQGQVVERPQFSDFVIHPTEYNTYYADASFSVREVVDPPFSVHIVDTVYNKKSVFKIAPE